jgi:predicted HNH restriction endonuclease
MLKSCSKCGRVHEHNCKAITRVNSGSLSNKFRNTQVWKKKRKKVFDRHKGLYQLCIRHLYDTYGRIYDNSIEVYHIETIVESYELRLEEGDLISLCTYNHKMVDRGQIPRVVLKNMIKD